MKANPTLAEIKKLVAAGESDALEFKRATGELQKAVETLCDFLNESCGIVVIGAAPKGRLLGQEVTDNTLDHVTTAVQNTALHPMAMWPGSASSAA